MGRRSQRGAALILLATILVVGVAWFAIGVLGRAAPSSVDRDLITGQSLRIAKAALLSYVAQYAARTDFDVPGRLPCPELPNSIGTALEGTAGTSCSNATAEIGRLPWRTLGADRLVDGYGEPFWYVLSPGFRESPVNFGTSGQLPLDGGANAAVALIVAPGPALNTAQEPDTPPAGCAKRNQGGNRQAATLNPLDFLECGNATGSYETAGNTKWFNDRAIAITASEWINAIAGAVADRIQRQAAPALNTWRSTTSLAHWGRSFLPYASLISTVTTSTAPATNDMCGETGTREGMPPTASVSSGTCSTSWSSGSVSALAGSLSSFGCAQLGTQMRCLIIQWSGPLTARFTLIAPRVARSFRAVTTSASITVTDSGGSSIPGATISTPAGSISTSSPNDATVTFNVTFPALAWGTWVYVYTSNLADAALLSDPAMSWYIANGWDRYTYYAISRAVTVNPGGSDCDGAGDSGCLTVNNLPASNGYTDDKRLVLVLMGPTILSQSRSCTDLNGNPQDLNGNGIVDCIDRAQYLEGQNASNGDNVFVATKITTSTSIATSSNDRVATCPFRQTDASGGNITICN